jgi:isopentenyldiphosphate isomerase
LEKRLLYNEKREPLDEFVEKGSITPTGKYYVVVFIWIQNSNNQFLIQKRSTVKGGKWGTTAGHPKDYESSLEGVITEVSEELSIDIANDDLLMFKTIQDNKKFNDLYYLKKDIRIEDMVLQSDEVDDVRWMTVKEIEDSIHNNDFDPNHIIMFYECLKFLNYEFRS